MVLSDGGSCLSAIARQLHDPRTHSRGGTVELRILRLEGEQNEIHKAYASCWNSNIRCADNPDLGAAFWISDNGLITGPTTNGLVDPLLPDFLETRAVLCKDGQAIDLATLGGNESGHSQ